MQNLEMLSPELAADVLPHRRRASAADGEDPLHLHLVRPRGALEVERHPWPRGLGDLDLDADVQPGLAARVRARAGGRQRAVDQCGVHPDLLFLPLGRGEHSAQAGPLLAGAVLDGEGRGGRGRWWRRGVVEEGDLGADGAEEAVDEGGPAHVGDVGAGREEARGAGGRERERGEVGAQAEQPPCQRHGGARRRRGVGGDFEGGFCGQPNWKGREARSAVAQGHGPVFSGQNGPTSLQLCSDGLSWAH